ncbi:hypothetical protein OG863_01500 [Streptomyces decoyicus]|uniref:Aminoglycoside phosphotransferase n=1 Tax=Streptomyces decoyicus TaxID=249567 RepID=A0ABZ1F971_9ACTN|nr:hypothetical protein [Streptomyces decoyicus]WSB66746.1 hypothetical protein OG863_01500 [Streptomyces decoyicus]
MSSPRTPTSTHLGSGRRAVLDRAVAWLAGVPLVPGHLDYGLPNVLPVGVIDWQHHGLVPLGYDTALALEII